MATMPQTPQADQDTPDDSDSGDFVIEITCKADGTFTVDTESSDDEASEEAGQGGGDESAEPSEGQTAGSIKEMMQIVLDLVKNKGEVGASMNDQASAFKAGYSDGDESGM